LPGLRPHPPMCDNRTMGGEGLSTQADLGRRIAEAREASGTTQAELATSVGLERTALVKIEAGTRKVSATELVAVAHALGRPVDWFFAESPPAVVSRRRDPAVGGFSRRLDLALELAARDVAFLTDRRILAYAGRVARKVPESFEDAENLAQSIRAEVDQPDGPLLDIQSVSERLGLLGFSLALGPDAGDAAYVEVGDLGVAVVNGTTDPGRRRFSLAHELGHHLVGDAYEPTPRMGAADTERMFNAFAAYFLMPRSAVRNIWNEFSGQSTRLAAIAVAVRFSVSWTAACNQLRNIGLIDARERERLIANDLRRGELLEFGERFAIELEPPAVPPDYARVVINAYRARRLTPDRTVELLHGTVTESDLPEPEKVSLEQLRSEFEANP
jgi:Zn-dependent peptidase ImmA (M78 family)/transcriptional regulator with XRE-family HTH domain